MKRILLTILMIFVLILNSVPAYAKTKWVTVKEEHRHYLGVFYCTHYCPCAYCCGPGGGKVTASGTKPTAGRTVGVNPRLIKYGTHLQVGKYKGYVAEDTGGGIGWKHLDIFCNSHQEALNAGVQYKKVWALTYTTKRVKLKEYKMKKMKIDKKNRDYLPLIESEVKIDASSD